MISLPRQETYWDALTAPHHAKALLRTFLTHIWLPLLVVLWTYHISGLVHGLNS